MRKRFTQSEVDVLEFEFRVDKYPTREKRVMISRTLRRSPKQIQVWFQNRRAKEKKLEKEGNPTPPINKFQRALLRVNSFSPLIVDRSFANKERKRNGLDTMSLKIDKINENNEIVRAQKTANKNWVPIPPPDDLSFKYKQFPPNIQKNRVDNNNFFPFKSNASRQGNKFESNGFNTKFQGNDLMNNQKSQFFKRNFIPSKPLIQNFQFQKKQFETNQIGKNEMMDSFGQPSSFMNQRIGGFKRGLSNFDRLIKPMPPYKGLKNENDEDFSLILPKMEEKPVKKTESLESISSLFGKAESFDSSESLGDFYRAVEYMPPGNIDI